MKILFLDIDGVLNSAAYRREKLLKDKDYSVLIEQQKVEMLKRIVDATGAQIVLSSSWNKFWEQRPIDSAGKRIQDALASFGLHIMDKTPRLHESTRSQQIDTWLQNNRYVEQYVILDDNDHGWSCRHRAHWVQTDGATGLEENAVMQAITVLRGNLLPVEQEPKKSFLQGLFFAVKRFFGEGKR